MAKIKDIAGGFFNDDTIYSPSGYTQARKVSNAIVDRNISDMQNEIQQGENLGAEARKDKKEDGKSSITSTIVNASSLPSKKEVAAKGKADKKAFSTSLKDSKDFAYKKADALIAQADELENEANDTEDEDEKRDLLKQAKAIRAEAERTRKDADITYNKSTKTETLVSPDNSSSGATATPADNSTPGTKEDVNAKYGRKANEHAPTADLPMARAGLFEDQKDAEQTLTDIRKERDDYIEAARQDKKAAKRNMREQSIVSDDFDLDDEFDSTDPFVASLFKKGKINKLLKDQIKEQYPNSIGYIAERVRSDPDNEGLSGREVRQRINEEIKKFIEPLWKSAGGDTQVNRIRLITPVAATIKKMMGGTAHESVTKVMNDKRASLEKKQNRSLKDNLFLEAFNMIEEDIDDQNKIAELKSEVKDARNNLTGINAEVREHKNAVDKARDEFAKGGRKSKTEHRDGWAFTSVSGDGSAAQYASRMEERDGKKMYVTYSVTAGSPDTYRDPVRIAEYQEFKGERNPNIMGVENFAEGRLDQVEGGFENAKAAVKEASDKQTFETLDGQNYFKYSEAHKIIAPKILKLIVDRGGKIDRETGKIYSVSNGDFPEGTDELYLDYGTAYKLAKGDDEEVAKLTGMSLEQVKARKVLGMVRDYSIGDARVTIDSQGRAVYQLPEDNKTVLSGATGRSFYINWNNPENRKVVEKYAKMGMTKQDIPLSELKTVNTSRSSEGNIDWADTKKTKAAEKAQKAQYTGSVKPNASILDALIGFGRK